MYTLEQIPGRKYQITVVVRRTHDGLREAPSEELIQDMINWCKENRCGRRTAYDQFQFRRKEEMMMFMLRWA